MTVAVLLALGSLLHVSSLQANQEREFQPRDLAVRDADTLRPPDAIGPDQARQDILLLRYALDHAYGGRRFVPEEDYAEAQRRLHDVAAQPPAAPNDLCDSIADILWGIPDNHLSIVSGSRTCGKESSRQRRRPSAGKNAAAHLTDETPWAVTEAEIAARKVPVLSVTRFPSPKDPSWEGYSEAIRKLLRSPALIVDLRGNGGGNDERGQELAKVLLGREPKYFFDAIVKRQTPGAFLVLMNPIRLSQLFLQREGKELPGFFREEFEESRQLYERALAGELPVERVDEFGSEPEGSIEDEYQHPVLVLIDAGCASSCEDTVLYLKQHHRAVTVGEPTGGYLHFGDVGCIVLPNSQLRVNIPTKHFQIRDAYYERRGIQPDVQVPAGADALDAAKKWLVNHFSKETAESRTRPARSLDHPEPGTSG